MLRLLLVCCFAECVFICMTADILEQIHISFGLDYKTIVVMWSSRDHRVGYVRYGELKEQLELTSNASDVAELPSESSQALRYIHRIELKGLKAGCIYYYRVCLRSVAQAPDETGSDVFQFRTLTNETTKPRTYIVYGDLGVKPDIPTYKSIENLVTSHDVTAIWHIGDFGYDLHSEQGKVGDEFMRKIQPYAASTPYMTSPGNHEIPGDFSHYRTRFSMPGAAWPMPLNRLWYSYDIGLVHFISFSSEVYFTYNEDYACEQFYWLLDDLLAANRNRDRIPWIIALGHRPMYCSNNNGDDCTNRFRHRWVRYGLEDLFHAQGVDLIIEAHEHSYERLWPVYRGEVTSRNYTDPRASVHVVTGAAGNIEGIDLMTKRNAVSDWSAFRADGKSQYTFGTLVIENRTHLQFAQIEATNGEVLDSFWLQQTTHGPFIFNVTCTGTESHPSCICPPPIRYMTYIIMAAVAGSIVVLGLIVLVIIMVIRYRHKKLRTYRVLNTDEDDLVPSERQTANFLTADSVTEMVNQIH